MGDNVPIEELIQRVASPQSTLVSVVSRLLKEQWFVDRNSLCCPPDLLFPLLASELPTSKPFLEPLRNAVASNSTPPTPPLDVASLPKSTKISSVVTHLASLWKITPSETHTEEVLDATLQEPLISDHLETEFEDLKKILPLRVVVVLKWVYLAHNAEVLTEGRAKMVYGFVYSALSAVDETQLESLIQTVPTKWEELSSKADEQPSLVRFRRILDFVKDSTKRGNPVAAALRFILENLQKFDDSVDLISALRRSMVCKRCSSFCLNHGIIPYKLRNLSASSLENVFAIYEYMGTRIKTLN